MPILPRADGRLDYLIGGPDSLGAIRPFRPYDDLVCDFLAELSQALFADPEAKTFPDLASFAFWCRRANIRKLQGEFVSKAARLGLGIVFHIAPSNVPVNFAFSYVFALLAGNASIVRVPTKLFGQTELVCRALRALFAKPAYRRIAEMSVFVRYEQNDEITAAFSALCQGRVIWGGDVAINHIRSLPLPERAREIAFADRYSFCVLDGESIGALGEAELERLAQGFYNDTFIMDQNACSSPSLVIWRGACESLAKAKERFWALVHRQAVSRYDLQPVNAVDKFHQLCGEAIDMPEMQAVTRHGNYLYRGQISALTDSTERYRGRYGFVLEYDTPDLADLAPIVTTRFQTLTYFGVDPARLLELVVEQGLPGIDRIVPVGTALDVGIVWDGYDIVGTLSRIIDIH